MKSRACPATPSVRMRHRASRLRLISLAGQAPPRLDSIALPHLTLHRMRFAMANASPCNSCKRVLAASRSFLRFATGASAAPWRSMAGTVRRTRNRAPCTHDERRIHGEPSHLTSTDSTGATPCIGNASGESRRCIKKCALFGPIIFRTPRSAGKRHSRVLQSRATAAVVCFALVRLI